MICVGLFFKFVILVFYKGWCIIVDRVICVVMWFLYSYVELLIEELDGFFILLILVSGCDGGVKEWLIIFDFDCWDMVKVFWVLKDVLVCV